MKNIRRQSGYSIVEILIVLLVIGIMAAVFAVNITAISSSVDIELATTQTVSAIHLARRTALAGQANNRTVNINSVVPAAHPGVLITNSAANGNNPCQQTCLSGNTICISGTLFCYSTTNQFEFQQYTGEPSEAHAIFLLSDRRKFCVLVKESGQVVVGEFVNNEWKKRSDLEQNFQ